jgi:hypothetical protein
MLAHIIIFGLLVLSNGATFLLDNEGWTIAGNKRTTEAKHQSYSLVGSKMSNYILGTDDLVNVDARNRDDKNLWYFRSPPITLVKKPFLMVFTITSFSGDFTKLNVGAPLVKITGADNLIIGFDGAQAFNGKITTMNVPFNKNIWSSKTDFSFEKIFQKPFVVEILGDWTRGIETVAIDNVEFYYS